MILGHQEKRIPREVPAAVPAAVSKPTAASRLRHGRAANPQLTSEAVGSSCSEGPSSHLSQSCRRQRPPFLSVWCTVLNPLPFPPHPQLDNLSPVQTPHHTTTVSCTGTDGLSWTCTLQKIDFSRRTLEGLSQRRFKINQEIGGGKS